MIILIEIGNWVGVGIDYQNKYFRGFKFVFFAVHWSFAKFVRMEMKL